jgi:hypothetical protein
MTDIVAALLTKLVVRCWGSAEAEQRLRQLQDQHDGAEQRRIDNALTTLGLIADPVEPAVSARR